ncbi:hypothetical protein HNQ80_003767 [Anaerosolibacter carboniphilus]|uniref:Uncharacterized protein n=1 Tax=Anaerosolibacter carboniphilus TaxID=1417629 RepID=A0A841KVG6_9FIRM|nr:hypothetical protein [Anaerosolibacter carboniphilus]MBB6217644.1 hypothetical protein [Anaerosolibacter carboniphilus]
MRKQLLVNTILEKLPASNSGIIFISAISGGSLSKIKYYVN